jgi:hypothetical protein
MVEKHKKSECTQLFMENIPMKKLLTDFMFYCSLAFVSNMIRYKKFEMFSIGDLCVIIDLVANLMGLEMNINHESISPTISSPLHRHKISQIAGSKKRSNNKNQEL